MVLTLFEIMSGLKINFSKSKLFVNKSDTSVADGWAKHIGCEIGTWPLSYLGVPIGDSHKKKRFWTPLTSKVKTRLAQWKSKFLNKAGRLILIRAVMNAMPVYWMGLFKVPGGIINEIDKVKRRFFWGEYLSGDSWSKKLHTINWNMVCISKTSGGLGLSFLTHKNISLLVKWFWKLHNDRNSLWYKVITGKYGGDIKDFLSSYNNSCSQNLSPTMKSLLEAYQCLPSRFKNMDNFVWSVGNGKNIQFWHDKWHALGILKHKFPRLFSIYIHRNDSIRDAVSKLSSYTTNSRWRRPLRQWE